MLKIFSKGEKISFDIIAIYFVYCLSGATAITKIGLTSGHDGIESYIYV